MIFVKVKARALMARELDKATKAEEQEKSEMKALDNDNELGEATDQHGRCRASSQL